MGEIRYIIIAKQCEVEIFSPEFLATFWTFINLRCGMDVVDVSFCSDGILLT